MKTPHKHAEFIKAWADGTEIEVLDSGCWVGVKEKWKHYQNPFWYSNMKYRIKPEPKLDLVYYGVIDMNTGKGFLDAAFTRFQDDGDHIKLTFDGETGKLKSAEVL
jgi:hypothetical protein